MYGKRLARTAGAASLVLGLALAVGGPATAQHVSPNKTVHGTCTADSSLKLKVKAHKDTITVRAKVKSDPAGELWAWTITDNAVPAATGENTTNRQGNFSVRESIPNQEGSDTINFTAVDTVTGETCTAETTIK